MGIFPEIHMGGHGRNPQTLNSWTGHLTDWLISPPMPPSSKALMTPSHWPSIASHSPGISPVIFLKLPTIKCFLKPIFFPIGKARTRRLLTHSKFCVNMNVWHPNFWVKSPPKSWERLCCSPRHPQIFMSQRRQRRGEYNSSCLEFLHSCTGLEKAKPQLSWLPGSQEKDY